MMAAGIMDDLRQAFVVAKNEMFKYVRGRKALILAVLILAVWGLATALPYIYGDGLEGSKDSLSMYLGSAWIVIIIIVAMFSSGTIVSEFEDRTALVLFTRPIRKGSIFLGKFIAAYVFGLVAIMIYIALSIVTVLVATGGLPAYIPVAMMFVVVTVFAATGVAMLISSVFKRSSTAAIITFFMLFLITNLISSTLVMMETDPWYMVEIPAMNIYRSLEYGLEFASSWSESQEIMPGVFMPIFQPAYDVARSVAVALAWGLVGLVSSFLLFARKEV
ncbi:MAG: ABC transporter permease subunit [Thermoplasmatales archaeon]|nr:ABC transporter permease subunit [Thermoplasmatales archaeon]